MPVPTLLPFASARSRARLVLDDPDTVEATDRYGTVLTLRLVLQDSISGAHPFHSSSVISGKRNQGTAA